ncbi:nuclear transport factor 2 family protein [Sphingomonas paeninsulae]|jgi:ketosteroid isomerase-like protein|uniref:Nuclear transport factor 2 family protein n=1 Tax=Sphingomonas paeninsulae TaxID=2319844 RepID=A0A494TPN9_SPHPE|nr:nuclear transport factor 2 family protein [Sphingomonas paeninsulae]AYJ87065.1 nuclear transport factor 2 family protein [Sphingomonas paeninsulae]
MADLETRIARLEAESDIRRLKARYLNACDAKDVDAIRACFTPDAELDYQPLGKFGPDSLIEAFTTIALHSPIVDVHQIHNGEIEIIDADHASARWSLGFSTYDPREGSFRLMGGFYYDEYIRTANGWRVSKSRHEPRTIIDGTIGADGVTAKSLLP